MTRARDIADQAYISDDKIQTNIALLAFKTAVNGSLAKYNLQDQVIDEYAHASDTSGVDDGPSTNHVLSSGSYSGTTDNSPTGGAKTLVDGYNYHAFTVATTVKNFVVSTSGNIEALMIAGGGGGGGHHGGGGGAGGLVHDTSLAVTAQTYALVIGTGGDGGASDVTGVNGVDSSGLGWTASGGGGGGHYNSNPGTAGGSAGGGAGAGGSGGTANQLSSHTGTSGTRTAYGTDGEDKTSTTSSDGHGGGATNTNGTGLTVANFSQFGVSGAFGGGGGAGGDSGDGSSGGAGAGAGGRGTGVAGGDATEETGSGGGGGSGSAGVGGDGGNGTILIRYLSTTFLTIDNITLQSTDTTAESAPTKADMVMLIEDVAGVVSLNTGTNGLQAYISMYETGGTKTWTQATLTDEGDWGADKRILVAHDVTLSGTSGTQMAYKITTHNQAVGLQTKIHATSIGWK